MTQTRGSKIRDEGKFRVGFLTQTMLALAENWLRLKRFC
jgi:hypothetical protein